MISKQTRDAVHDRDEGKPCIICGQGEMCKYDVCAHYQKSRHKIISEDMRNIHLVHDICNCKEEYSEVLQNKHRASMIDREGLETVEYLEQIHHKSTKEILWKRK